MNKKASIFDIIIWMIVGFITLLFLGLWVYGHNAVTNTLTSVAGDFDNEFVNITQATNATFVVVNNSLPILHFLAIGLIFAMAISILISNFLVKANPVFFILYVLVVIVAVIFSVFISNAYEDLLQNQIFGSTLGDFTAGSFVMLFLPLWTTIIGVFGAILLFIGITRDRETEGSIPI